MFASLLRGKKTYAAAVAIVGLAAAQALGVTVPNEAWFVLNALGLAGLRAAVEE